MRLLAIENEPSSLRGGQELSLLDVCRGLAERGHEIHLVYNKEGNLLEDYRRFCRSLTCVKNYSINRANVLASSGAWLGSLMRAMRLRVDVIYANQYHDTFFGGALARLKSLPLACHLRLLPPETFCGQWRIGLRAATKFIAVSDAVRQAYAQWGFDPAAITRVYNGIDLERFTIGNDRQQTRKELGLPSDAFVALYAGRMDRDKDLERLIDLFAKLRFSQDKGRLLMIGGPLNHSTSGAALSYLDELKSRCVLRGIEKQVHWLGRRNDLPRWFRAADVTLLFCPVEAFGRTLVESMACGTPAVGVARGGIPEILSGEFRRFCVEPENDQEFIRVLRSLRGWRKSDPTLGERCRSHAQGHFALKDMVEGVEAVLQEAVREGAVRRGPAIKSPVLCGKRNRTLEKAHVCLISSVHLWVNPRLVKEADALVEEGYEVTVITVSQNDWASEMDDRLLRNKKWRAIRVNLIRKNPDGRLRWFIAALRSKVCGWISRWIPGTHRLAEEGYYRAWPRVLREAVRCGADLYIAHTQGALPIAARAARRRGAPFGFDCEDLLADEIADGLRAPHIRETILMIERRYLPGAAYVSATSRAMAAHLVRKYGIVAPRVIHNVFSKRELDGIVTPEKRRAAGGLRLVWISATIGPGRGIEDAVHALALLPACCELQLFGRMPPDYEAMLHDLLRKVGVASRVHIAPIPEPENVMQTVAGFDVGLTLDLNDCVNRSLTICNKLFLYLQGGLAIAATNTPGQREVMETIPGAGFVYEPGDHQALARGLARYVGDPAQLARAKQAAWKAGQQTYCWDKERSILLEAVRAAVGPR